MDAARSIPISARISAEDAAFLAGLKIEGAVTPSDKLRAILSQARRQYEGQVDYAASLQWIREALAPALQRLRETEHRTQEHSELVLRLGEWVPQVVALLASYRDDPKHDQARQKQGLVELERALADKVFQLLEAILRLGITALAPCYVKNLISERLPPVLDLARVIEAARQQAKEQEDG